MADLIGYKLGNFVFSSVLGRGGMGVVYLAEHERIVRRKAVKVLNEDKARNASLVRRFFDEATAASACQHDHIVGIEDCGTFVEDNKSHHYIEMEYLEGRDVAAECRLMGRFDDVGRAVGIVGYAADALTAAHDRGIVHRDLKPENLFLTRRGRRADYVKVLDFGIARLTGDLSSGLRTRTGSVIGTPEYMSPEQANGLHPDGKSDVYSLAVVLYRMLAGRVPFRAQTFTLLAVKINRDEVPPLAVSRSDVPEAVARAIAEGMRKRPEDRPTMFEFRQLLLAGAPDALTPELSVAGPRQPPTAAPGSSSASSPASSLQNSTAPSRHSAEFDSQAPTAAYSEALPRNPSHSGIFSLLADGSIAAEAESEPAPHERTWVTRELDPGEAADAPEPSRPDGSDPPTLVGHRSRRPKP